MSDLFRDAPVGQLIRWVSGNKWLQYPEEKDPSIWKNFIDKEKSGNMAMYGAAEPPNDEEKNEEQQQNGSSPSHENRRSDSSGTLAGNDQEYNQMSGKPVDPEKGKNIDMVSWYGPEDPDNPQNWSQRKKFFVAFQICLLTTSIYIGSAIYTPGEGEIVEIFGVSEVVATLGLTLFVAGYGLGPSKPFLMCHGCYDLVALTSTVLWAPMSEIPQIGRNPIYLATLLVFVLFQIPTALSVNIGMLFAFRFLTGFFGSPVLATGGASLSDIFSAKKRAYAMAVYGIAAICGPTLGPLIGGFAAAAEGWTWTIWELMWLSGFCWVFLMFCFPETSANNILLRRTKRLRKLTGNDKLRCEPEIMGESMTAKDIVMMSVVRPFTLNFTEPMVFLLNLYIALIYGLLYVWFESFVIVFGQIYGFNLGEQGLAFLGILVGAFVVLVPFFYYLHHYLEPQFDENGDLQPEKRLPPACVGAFAIPICLFWFGWSSRASVHWIVPIIGSAWFSVGAVLLFNSVLNYLPDAYPEYAASVLAGNDFMRSSFGAGFPLFARAMYDKLGVGWASSLLGFLAIAFIPIPFVLYKYGETLRKNHSKHARKDI
ncbi:hypothetical protein MBLNU459_g1361t2 [Dothideomycetes sp. NU459]